MSKMLFFKKWLKIGIFHFFLYPWSFFKRYQKVVFKPQKGIKRWFLGIKRWFLKNGVFRVVIEKTPFWVWY